ncbi:MAG TPA: DUF4239 domain-containing protein [Pyrinomonadaceae bacterium]|nr:DUF4239 domain-containing protein [Pyrinomonadaceae bacterium]
MPTWLYDMSPLHAGLVLVAIVELVSLAGLLWTRWFAIPRFKFGEGINDAVSGTVQAIGVFYGITVGLIAVAVWNTNINASDLVSREASAIGALYRDVSGYPAPARDELRAGLREYTVFIIDESWPAQRKGQILPRGTAIMDAFQAHLYSFQPANQGQMALHSETLRAYNHLIEYRRLRLDAVRSGLSGTMWAVIWLGAAISIGVAYFYQISDVKLHAALIILMSGFLALVLLMITINDRPFFGRGSISPAPYELIRDHLIDLSK